MVVFMKKRKTITRLKKDIYGNKTRYFYNEKGEQIGFYSINDESVSIRGFGLQTADYMRISKNDFEKHGEKALRLFFLREFDQELIDVEVLLKWVKKDLGVIL